MKKFLLLKTFAFTILFACNLIAATITVTTTDDEITTNGDCSLREAVYNANNNDDTYPDCDAGSSRSTDTIILESGNYILTYGYYLFTSDDISIQGVSADETIIDADGNNSVFYISDGNFTIDSVTITGGTTESGGAAGSLCSAIDQSSSASTSEVNISNTIITDNNSDGDLFSVCLSFLDTFTLSNSTIKNTNGGGLGLLFIVDSIIENSTISNNTNTDTSTDGAGLTAYLVSSITITQSTISNNESANDGGGVSFSTGSFALINQSTISNNTSDRFGGGIYSFADSDSPVMIVNSTISGNSASGSLGGGIYNSYGEIFISNTTITDNTASDGGGIYANDDSSIYLKSTILSGNDASDDGDNCYQDSATVSSEGYNFFETSTDSDCGFSKKSSDIETSHTYLYLSSLNDNGGPTETHSFSSSSKAYNAGSCDSIVDTDEDGTDDTITVDQRGKSRKDNCDIGSYEYQSIRIKKDILLDTGHPIVIDYYFDPEKFHF